MRAKNQSAHRSKMFFGINRFSEDPGLNTFKNGNALYKKIFVFTI